MLTDLKLFAFKILGIIFILWGVVTLIFGQMVIFGLVLIVIGAFFYFKSNKSRVVLMRG